jgi:site-specific DNA-methyltransferase (adenine-specific)
MRNQRGYGTQKNWMAIRQECLYYVKGEPNFTVQYTDIPKILRRYCMRKPLPPIRRALLI